MRLANDNKDLVWDLDAFAQRQKASDFVLSFENRLCVYSGSVGQLYTNYNIFFPKEEDRKLVILPNPYAPHDTFNGIPDSAISATGLYILPALEASANTASADTNKAPAANKSPAANKAPAANIKPRELLLRIPFRSGGARFRTVPLQVGLRVVGQNRSPERPFLPVLMKGDLRELDSSTPCLHLHSIHLERLSEHSMLERDGMRKVIQQHLAEL